MEKLRFKFSDKSSETARSKLIGILDNAGASSVHPLFPNESDAGLASLYTVEAGSHATWTKLMSLLDKSIEVEFAEVDVRRKLL